VRSGQAPEPGDNRRPEPRARALLLQGENHVGSASEGAVTPDDASASAFSESRDSVRGVALGSTLGMSFEPITYYLRATIDDQPGTCCLNVKPGPPTSRARPAAVEWDGTFESEAECRAGATATLRLAACEGDFSVRVISCTRLGQGMRLHQWLFTGIGPPPRIAAPNCHARYRT
jgi:hypothetical protein